MTMVMSRPAMGYGPAARLAPTSAHREPAQPLGRDDLRLLSTIATGVPITSVAQLAGISDRTVRRRVRLICESIGVKTAIEAVAWAARRRLI
jgi:DNA-binding NarL/FixJ family response regulator